MALDPAVRPSTLNEVNQEISKRVFELLSYVAPRTWVDARRVVYSPIDELDTAISLFETEQTKQRPEHLQVPFCYFTRYTGMALDDTFDFAHRPWADWVSTYAHQVPRSNSMVKFIPATFRYLIKVFDNRVEKMESLIDGILHRGIRMKSKCYHYNSEVLQIIAPYSLEFGNPQYDRNPNLKQKTQERGRLYSIIIPLEVRCALGESLPAKRIEKIDVGIYRWRGQRHPTPNADDKIDEFMIDSNTFVGGE